MQLLCDTTAAVTSLLQKPINTEKNETLNM